MSPVKRRNFILLLAVLLAAVLAGTIALRYRSVSTVVDLVEALPSGVELALQDVDYMHSEDGIPRWRLQANRAERGAQQGRIAVDKLVLTFFDEQGAPQTVLHARQGEADKAFTRVLLQGDVRLESTRGYRLATEQLVYYQEDRQMVSESPVVFESEDLVVTGRKLILDLDAGTMTLIDDVEAMLPLTGPEKDSR